MLRFHSSAAAEADPRLSAAAVILRSNQNHEHWVNLTSLIGLEQGVSNFSAAVTGSFENDKLGSSSLGIQKTYKEYHVLEYMAVYCKHTQS
jgi:hypothetical protein